VAVGSELSDDITFGVDGGAGETIVEGEAASGGDVIIDAALNGEGALAGGGKDVVEWDGMEEVLGEAEAGEAGGCEERGVHEAIGHDFADAGVDVASEEDDLEVGAESEELGAAAWAGGSDDGGVGQVLNAVGFGGDEDIVDGSAAGGGDEGEAWGVLGGEVFEAVDGDVGPAIEEGLFDGTGEEAFSAEGCEGAVGDLVAFGFDELETELNGWVETGEPVADHEGLGLGEVAFSGGDDDVATGWPQAIAPRNRVGEPGWAEDYIRGIGRG
jgi:hypothetical protein